MKFCRTILQNLYDGCRKTVPLPAETVQFWADGLRVCAVADDVFVYQPAKSLPEFSTQKRWVSTALSQRVANCFHPFRLETKLQFARDDPAFLVLLSGLLCSEYNTLWKLVQFERITFNRVFNLLQFRR